MKAKKAKPTHIGGVSREMVMMAAGYCRGLASSDRFPMEKIDRDILTAASKALVAAGRKLYQNKP